MAKFKKRRDSRYNNLRKQGFGKQEAREFSAIPSNVPYFRKLKGERSKQYRSFKKSKNMKGKAEAQIERAFSRKVRGDYVKKGFINTTWNQQSIWAMFRSYENKYAPMFPAYTSPFRTKQRVKRDNKTRISTLRQSRNK